MIFSLISVLSWAASDTLIKSYTFDEKYAEVKFLIWNALSWVVATAILMLFFPWEIDFENFGRVLLVATPGSVFYGLSCFFLCLSMNYLECSISSTVVQISGGISVIAIVLFYLFSGQISSVFEMLGIIDIAGTLAIIIGMILLYKLLDKEDKEDLRPKKEHKWGAFILIIPILGGLFDSLSTIQETLLLSGDFDYSYTVAEDLFVMTLYYIIAAFGAEIFLFKKEKKLYNPFRKGQMKLLISAAGDVSGAFFSTYALEQNPVIAIPVTSSYCAFTVLFSRLFIKEKLTPRKYLYVFIVIAGIIMLGFGEL